MSQESLIFLNERKSSRIQFMTRISFESVFPNKEVPICLPESESSRWSLSPKKLKENEEAHQIRKPTSKLRVYKEDFRQQREDEGYSYESYDPDDPDFEVDEEDLNYEASEYESPSDDYSEENILEDQSEEEEAGNFESSADGMNDERKVHVKTEDDAEDQETQKQQVLFLNRKGGRAHATLQEVNKGKRYCLYHDLKILKAVDAHAAKYGPSILKSEEFWENIQDSKTEDPLLGNTRYSSSIFERYRRRLRYVSEDAKERIYKLAEGLSKQDMLNCYCQFCTNDDGNVCFMGVKKIDEKTKYLLQESPQNKVKPQKSLKRMKNSLIIPNHGYGTRASKSTRNERLCYYTDSSFTAGPVDVSGNSEEEIVSDYSEESSESDLLSENVLNLVSASQPAYRAGESDFWSSPSLSKRAVRYGASQPLTEEDHSRETTSRKRLLRMREKGTGFEMMNKKRKAFADFDDEEEEYYRQDFPLQKKIHTENIYNDQSSSALKSQRSSLEVTSRGSRKLRIDEDSQSLSQKEMNLNMLVLYVNSDSDSDKKKDSNLLKVSQNYPNHFLNTLLEFQGELSNRQVFENHLGSQGYQVLWSQESQIN